MQMIKTPVNGMKDIEPREMELRQFLLTKIRDTYSKFGFSEIGTPAMEHVENLLSDLGWDNEKLIFKVLKRGEKLEKAIETGNVNDLIDSGLRYDLTVPLCRFYSNNKDKLVTPFKAMQIGNVYRADRPQKGRFREFMQCDIDMFGESTNIGEIEVLLATSTFLNEIGFNKYGFSFDINDRRILKAICNYAGFSDKDFESVCITLDKLDKIGFDGVSKELSENGYNENQINKIKNIFINIDLSGKDNIDSITTLKSFCEKLGDSVDISIVNNLVEIINIVSKNANVKINFNPTLVRGMGYYTGPIFEIKCDKFSGSVGGGGRYDGMAEKFGIVSTPALGISIGFERIIGILLDDNYLIPRNIKKIVYLVDKDALVDTKNNAIAKALEERKNGNIVYVATVAKNKKFQIENLEKNGFTEFITIKD